MTKQNSSNATSTTKSCLRVIGVSSGQSPASFQFYPIPQTQTRHLSSPSPVPLTSNPTPPYADLPRTSTSSLQTALELLGFHPCYHTITSLLPNARRHGPLWLAAIREPSAPARRKILFEVTNGYSAIVDGPGCFFISDWLEMYSDAKFVLGLRRSPAVWLDLVNGSMGKGFGRGLTYWLAWFVPELYFGFSMNNLWEAQTRERYGVGVRTEGFYQAHNEYVKSVVPKGRLLEFQAGDGWEPLARFLGKEVPMGAFPHRNDARTANGLIRRFVVYGVGAWVVFLVCGWVVVSGVIMYSDI